MMMSGFIVFFSSRRRHTRWPRDWSSDVCSSDLHFLFYFVVRRLKSQESAATFLTSEPGWLWEFMVFVQPARSFYKDYRNACICFSTQAGENIDPIYHENRSY